jgi:Sulfotransferase family
MPSVSLSGTHNITFVQIPKNAGTSIGSWLKENRGTSSYQEWYNHPTHSRIYSPDNFSFTVIRNPWDRMVSMYFFIKNWTSPDPSVTNSDEIRQFIYKINNFNQFPSFEVWLKNIKNFKLPHWIQWRPIDPQLSWLNVPVNHVIRYENLKQDFQKIQEMFNVYTELPELLVTKGITRTDYKDYYNSETKQIVLDYFKEDIEKWQYEF